MSEIPEWNTAAGFLDTPIWDNKTQRILCQDFASPTNNVYSINYTSNEIIIATVIGEGRPTGVFPVERCPDLYIIGFEPNMTLCRWDGRSSSISQVRTLFQGVGHIDKGWVDLKGRLYVGTSNISIFCADVAKYPLYRYDKGTVTLLIQNLKTTTGICIDHYRSWLYVVDLCYYQVVRFYLDLKTGDICEFFFCFHVFFSMSVTLNEFFFSFKGDPVIILDLKTLGIYPLPAITHITVDTDGRLYITMYRSAEVWIVDPL